MSVCIVKTSKEFKDLQSATGLGEFALEMKVSTWQNENGVDLFPTAQQLRAKDPKQAFYDKYGESTAYSWDSRFDLKAKFEAEFPELEFLMNKVQGSAKFQVILRRMFQEESKGLKKMADPEITSRVKAFLQKIGVTTINVADIKDAEGNILSATSVADLTNRIIEVVDNKADVSTLTEEAVHFFISLLKDNKLLETMIKNIDKYDSYNEVASSAFYQKQYNGNDRLIRIEAVGKQIVKTILNKQPASTEEQTSTFMRFWNNILTKMRSMFSVLTKEDKNDIYETVGKDIMKGDVSKLNTDKKIEGKLFQEDKQSEIVNNLDNKFQISLNSDLVNSKTGKKGVYELNTPEGLKKIENRVSDDVEKVNQKRGFSERTSKEKAQDEVRKQIGIKGHDDINNIITRLTESASGVHSTQKSENLGKVPYEKLEEFFTEFVKGFPAGTKFYSEKTIFDELKQQAGTIDLLAVLPDGKVEIYDWKFIEFKQKDSEGKIINKSVAWYKEENYNVQLTRYRQILRNNYGVKEFGKTRVIPIRAEYKKDNLKFIEIGNTKLDGLDKPYLNPVPISGLSGGELGVEYTGDTEIDDLLKVLLQNRKRIVDKTEYTAEGKIKKSERLQKINDSIKSLQTEGDIKLFLEDAVFELNYINNVGIENLNNDDLTRAKELLDYYSNLSTLPKEQKIKYKETLAKVTLNAQDIHTNVIKEYKKRILDTANNVGVKDPFELQPETGMLARLFSSISQRNHPLIKTFYKLLTKQNEKTYRDTETLNEKIKEKVKNLESWGKSKGLSGLDLYRDMLQYKDGKWTGKLINQWAPEYYESKNNAIVTKDYEWLASNTNFDQKRYDELLERNISVWTKIYKGETDGDIKLQKRTEEFEKKFNASQYPSALLNKGNRFIKPNESWRSNEWKKLQDPSNKPLKEFYDLFKTTIDEFREFLPLDLEGNFIPNIKNDLIDQIVQNGLSSVSGLGTSISQHMEAGSDETVGMIDEITGERVRTVPLLYTGKLNAENKSRDLGKVLSIFGNMAYNYKHMAEIESSASMLQDIMGSQKQLITTSDGKKLRSKVTGEIAAAMGDGSSVQQLNDFINYYVYGIKVSSKDLTMNIMGKEISRNKFISKTLAYYSAKALGLNLLSGMANGLGGVSNALFEGVKGRFYNNKEYSKALAMISTKNSKAYAAIEFFDIASTNSSFRKANELSVSKVTREMTMEKLYVLQRAGDFVVENSVLLALMQSHTIVDGSIVKITDPSQKSLYDQMDISKDKVDIEGLSEEEYHKFRRKAKYLYSTMKGSTNSEDINAVKLTIFGQALMQFRGWIPRMAYERLGDLRYTEDLETWEMGKFKSFWSQTVNKQILPNIFRSLAAGGVLGIGAGSINSKAVTQKAMQLYNDAKLKNPDLKITQEEFIALHKANLRSTAMELQIIIAIGMILIALNGDDDDDKDPARMASIKILNRFFSEMTFFVSPGSTESILKKPIPIFSLATDVTGFFSDFVGEGVGMVTGDEKRLKKNKPGKKFNKIFPVSNALENFWALADPDYNKN